MIIPCAVAITVAELMAKPCLRSSLRYSGPIHQVKEVVYLLFFVVILELFQSAQQH